MRAWTSRLAAFGLICLPLALTGCATEGKAPVAPSEPSSTQQTPTEPPETTAQATPIDTEPAPVETRDRFRDALPDRYVVEKGDTLWDIADHFLKDPWYWPEIWYNNPQIDNPHLIYPGDVIALIWVDGEPRLQIASRRPTVVLSPRMRTAARPEPISTIPLSAIRQFLIHPQVLSAAEIESLPRVIDSRDNHLIMGTGDKIYARPLASTEHSSYHLLRKGEPLIDPATGNTLGFEAVHVGEARLGSAGEPASLTVTDSEREVLIGDRLKPKQEDPFERQFQPRAPEQPVDGQIIHLVDAISQIGQYQVAVINRGANDGLEAGHVLAVERRGRTIVDRDDGEETTVKLPDERSAVMLTFLTYPEVAYALVVEAERPVARRDRVTNP